MWITFWTTALQWKNLWCHLRRFSFPLGYFLFPLRFFPRVLPTPLVFYVSFFLSLSSSSPHLTSPSLQFLFRYQPLLLFLLQPVCLSVFVATSWSFLTEHKTRRALVCKRSRLRVPAVYNRSRKLLAVANLQQTSFTYRSPTNSASNYVFGVSVT